MKQVLDTVLRPVTRWAEHSQQQACRNAMVASTALTQGRAEWDEVRRFVAADLALRAPGARADHPAVAAARLG